ncbi:homoserine O-acetyltransferase MetX [Saccharomonospora xinjiangensis]|uniref:Homoserine O-acetyltransferase n=1 Tax=Saccharomonospora xinjiangensis XJ-54 TaxID=882086 RepID=I0UYA3_9PSEU|nr:homoserine O-acetyltransferase [Saccharomonospora xinjiangensis]EID52856.1 homoserine O-acetyltransferase [Saccharomonospora xinjiangensis XJ-54]
MTVPDSTGLPPATGAWQAGDPPGRRQWFRPDSALRLESGGQLPGVEIAYETWGTLNADRSNAVLVEHALTGDSHAAGDVEPGHPSPGWWDGLIGQGKALDTGELFVVVPNVLGGCQGSTGPASLAPDGRHWGSRFPHVSVRDQVAVEIALADALGIERWAAVLGGSMGGMRALEWAVMRPERVRALMLLASPAATSADQIAWAAPQIHAILADANWRGGDYHGGGPGEGPHLGLGVARRIAHATYRSAAELDERFGRSLQGGDDPRFAVESYLDHHAHKLVHRFDAASYVVLTRSMNGHDVGRGRGGIGDALSRVTARTIAVGVDSDRLYPPEQVRELADGIPAARYAEITSPYGHDSFLIETEQVAALVKELLDE